MDNHVRPLNLGEILDRAVQLYRHNFWLFVGTSALPLMFIFALAIPFIALFAVSGVAGALHGGNTIPIVIAGIVIGLAAMLIYIGVYVFSYAGITQATVSLFRGEKPTFRATLSSVKPRFWTYLGSMLLQGIFGGILPSLAASVLILPLIYFMTRPSVDFASKIALGVLLGLVAVAAIGVMFWLVLSYAMGMAACVAEKKTAWESLIRSWKLSPGARGRIFVTYLLMMALSFAISMVFSIPLLILIAVSPSTAIGAGHSPALFIVIQMVRAVMDFASQALLMPILFIALVLFYFDQRIRKEGFDIEWMMQQAGLTQTATAAAGSAPVAPPDTLR